jgi:hypothetical protein
MHRRNFIKNSIFTSLSGSFALDRLGGVPIFSALTDCLTLNRLAACDAWYNLAMLSRSATHFLQLEQSIARAQSVEDSWSLVTIKIVNHVHTPLVFKLGNNVNGVVTGNNPSIKSKSGKAGTHMELKGADLLSDTERFANLRMNKWFADILGKGIPDSDIIKGTFLDGKLSPFPAESKVAIQAALSLDQTIVNNHSLTAFKLLSGKPEMALHLAETGLIRSPLGIAAFNMGDQYDKAEGVNPTNVVVGANGEQAMIQGRPVADFINLVNQNVKSRHVDLNTVESTNLTLKFDKLIAKDPVMRKEVLLNQKMILDNLTSLSDAGNLESRQSQIFDDKVANGQANISGFGAKREFLAQASFVQKSLEIPGKPFRNFQLFLNINDLDAADLDSLNIDTANVNQQGAIKSLTYIEGMRQLAIALNMLATSIANGHKMMVVVMSEGGRSSALSDDTVSFGLVMGPGGPGGLKDALYSNMVEINKADSRVVTNPGGTANVIWSGEDLRTEANLPANAPATVGDLQRGVIEFLEEKTQKSGSRVGLGNFVKLRRAV